MKGEGEEWREEKKGRGWVGGWVGALPHLHSLFSLSPLLIPSIPGIFSSRNSKCNTPFFFCMAVPHAQARLELAMQQR